MERPTQSRPRRTRDPAMSAWVSAIAVVATGVSTLLQGVLCNRSVAKRYCLWARLRGGLLSVLAPGRRDQINQLSARQDRVAARFRTRRRP
jgi:hypothetical protein